MGLPERIGELVRELSLEEQTRVLAFVEALGRGADSAKEPRRGSLEALQSVLRGMSAPGEDEPEWSPFDIEPTQMGGA